ncbi:MAG: hypothetical protein KF858_06305 [Candidatus Sumerlaeia bacterium]|nr:hypothetical protein [Candidatus Sumerlaeia bacterium]
MPTPPPPPIETSRHLFQAPRFRSPDGRWHDWIEDAHATLSGECVIDPAAILSLLCFSQVCGDNTLVRGIERQPWLSEIRPDGSVRLEEIPPHGTIAPTVAEMATEFLARVEAEARRVCAGRAHIYLLLTGGLDSRIVAGVVARLHREGFLNCTPVAVTWGFPDSRDAGYAEAIARHYGFEWINAPFGPEVVRDNIDVTGKWLGALHSPEMLHYMTWFERVERDALVLAGSYGDSIGRAEFAGLHLLELGPRKPSDPFALMRPGVRAAADRQVREWNENLRRRASNAPLHAQCEHWMQGYRMRGNLCHALTVINRYATIYQMFTDPEVYGYMWSLHPACRTDDMYAMVLERLDPFLARLPWARTNRALSGATHGAREELKPHYHDYTGWSAGALRERLEELVDPEWFGDTGVFDSAGIVALREKVAAMKTRVGRANDVWFWLAGFRSFVSHLEAGGLRVRFDADASAATGSGEAPRKESVVATVGAALAEKSPGLTSIGKRLRTKYRMMRRARLRQQSLRAFPPQPPNRPSGDGPGSSV